jgi:hypothetical protein
MANAFIDRAVCRWHADRMPLLRKISQRVFPSRRLTYFEKVIIAETKQACATLAELGDEGLHSYRAFPHAENQISPYLNRLDWRQPWDAGAHFASLAVFIATQAPAFLSPAICQKLEAACQNYVETLVHPENGGYYLGPTPEYGMLVNGAMKVLTGLDWLNIPVHYPRQLIDTCLAKSPQPEGCHLVDAVYTLYRCAQLTTYRRKDIIRYGHQILKMIRAHYHPREGGFSYFPGKSQTQYYGIPITKGLDTADIHGTVLLVWAVAMTLDLLEENIYHWRVIKP